MSEPASYGKVHRLGGSGVGNILAGPVYVEEKIDGSQFTCGVTNADDLWCRSRSTGLDLAAPGKLFAGAVATAQRLHRGGVLAPGMVLHGEAIRAPRHNKLTYGIAPPGNLVLFDIRTEEYFWRPESMHAYARECGLTYAEELGKERIYTLPEIKVLSVGPSALGGCAREGVVIKQAGGTVGKRLRAKLVSDSFREVREKPKGDRNVSTVVDQYATAARWDKVIQHLRESGRLTGTPKDIGPLMQELATDMREECEDEIRDYLWPRIWKEIVRGVGAGLPNYYQAKLIDDLEET